jgi:hypothetical protein
MLPTLKLRVKRFHLLSRFVAFWCLPFPLSFSSSEVSGLIPPVPLSDDAKCDVSTVTRGETVRDETGDGVSEWPESEQNEPWRRDDP